ncbi:MAG: histidine kinase [Lewinellaceae bacterium]|nr:histidine kinase [Lewinellaceae bacterium]
MRLLSRTYLTLLLGLLLHALPAQRPHPAFRNYGTGEGLPSSEVFEVLQDRHGYLWFGTDNGVSRFNGYEFENFGPAQGLANNVVFYLHEDRWGRIWMATLSKNLYYYDYAQDSILAFPHNHLFQEMPYFDGRLLGFYVDSVGNVYRSSTIKGFIRISPGGEHQFLQLPDVQNAILMLEIEGAGLITSVSPRNRRYSGEFSFHFYVYDGFDSPGLLSETLALERKPFFLNSTPNFYPLNQGYYLYQLWGQLFLVKNEKIVWSQPELSLGMASAYQMKDGRILVGGNYGGGVRKYAGLEALKQSDFQTYLPGLSISHILEDSDGGFWLTSTENGVYYLQDWGFSIYDESSGLSGENVTAIALRDPETLYFGLKSGSVFELNIPDQEWRPLPEIAGGGEIFGLFWDTIQNQLVINSSPNTYYYKPGQTIREQPVPGRIKLSGRKFNPSPDGRNLYSNSSSGFIRLTLEKSDSLFFSSIAHNWVMRLFDIHEDRSGKVWAAGLDGLFEYIGDTLLPANLHPALSSRIEEIGEFEDGGVRQAHAGALVFGTKGRGVVIWDGEEFQIIGEEEGLTSSMIERLHIDSAGNLWVGTLNGLNKVSFDGDSSFSIQRFTIANGLPSNEINDIQSRGDQVWVGTTRGLVKLPPDKEIENDSRPPVIEQLLVNGAEVRADSLPTLSYRQNNLQLTFLTLDFSQNGKIDYRYRLLPNESWSLTRQRTVDYPALPPGDYTFEVQSQNKDGFWSEPARLAFSIRPPFWQRPWFWAALGLLAAGLAYRFYRNRVDRLKKEVAFQKQLAEKEREMNALQRSALRAQMNPHFLSNCLNTIQSFIAKGEKMTAMRYLSNFNRLLRRALDFSQVNEISLEEEVQLLKDYIELEQMRFGGRFTYQVEVDEAIDLFDTQIPPMLVQPFVENAIIHAFPDEVNDPKLYISYRQEGENLLITVTDNGIGIAEAKRRKASGPRSKRKSYGMGLPARRLQLLGEQEEEPVVIGEVKGEKGEVLGTWVRISIKR